MPQVRRDGPKPVILFGRRFQGTGWQDWLHTCDEAEAAAVLESAHAHAVVRGSETIAYSDYLHGARYMFEAAHGLPDSPREGDTQVLGVRVPRESFGQTARNIFSEFRRRKSSPA